MHLSWMKHWVGGLEECLGDSTSWEDWMKIDQEECRVGGERGKPREKVFKVEDMLSIARG